VRAIALPVKSLTHAKSRLSSFLSPLERGALALAMFEDVLDATLTVDGWETWVVTTDESVLEIGLSRGAHAITEEGASLPAAIKQVEDEAGARSIDALAILHADTPLVTVSALRAALHTLGPVVIAPSTDERGTNLLLRRPPGVVPSRFGPDSFRRHLEVAAERGLPTAVGGTGVGAGVGGGALVRRRRAGRYPDCPGVTAAGEDPRRLPRHGSRRTPGPDVTGASVEQGTIKRFDERERTGSLLTDDRVEVRIDPTSLEGSQIRTLRIGQRVSYDREDVDGTPVARGLHLVTVGS
jgi:2-phospho-L-lactate guanylyltransferase